jgi:hypothetical protein
MKFKYWVFHPLVIMLVQLSFASCDNDQKEKVKTVKNTLEDSVTNKKNNEDVKKLIEETVLLNPKFDNSKISGIGIFKIGNSIDSTIGKLLNSGYKLISLNNYKQQSDYEIYLSQKGKLVAQVSPINPLKRDQFMYIQYTPGLWCKKTKLYLINEYKIDNLKIKKITATYYNDKLVGIFSSYDQALENAIEVKYGKPDKDLATENRYYTKIWKNNDLEIESLRDMYFKVWIDGSYQFIKNCSEKDFETESDLEKSKLKSGVPNL